MYGSGRECDCDDNHHLPLLLPAGSLYRCLLALYRCDSLFNHGSGTRTMMREGGPALRYDPSSQGRQCRLV